MKKILTLLIALAIVLTSSMAIASGDEVNVAADALLLRPLGLAVLIGTSGAFVMTLPIAAITRSMNRTFDVLLKEPFQYTFIRPLGDNS